MKQFAQRYYNGSKLPYLLLPASVFYYLIVKLRSFLYKAMIFKSHKLTVPVIVVGNLTLGGSGKTPLVIAIVQQLKQQGFKPGIISRGYGSQAPSYPYSVEPDSNPKLAGDEPLLMAIRCQCPVIIDANRPRAGKYLLDNYNCDIIVSDDGLQHHALQRDIEIVVVDGERRFGNGLLFPAGPLRELTSRLNSVDFIVANGKGLATEWEMKLKPQKLRRLRSTSEPDTPEYMNDEVIHAVAGIGHPKRFFNTLQSLGYAIREHSFPDHHQFSIKDFKFNPSGPIIMTEKDAVKCRDFSMDNCWYLPVRAELDARFMQQLNNKIRNII